MWDNLKLHQDKVQPCYVLWNAHCKSSKASGSKDFQTMCFRRWSRFKMSSFKGSYLHVNCTMHMKRVGIMHNSVGDVLLVMLHQAAGALLSEASLTEGWRNELLIRGTSLCPAPLSQVQTPSCVRASVKKGSSSPWSCCKVLCGASRKATSTSPWARSSSFWGQSWVLKDKGQWAGDFHEKPRVKNWKIDQFNVFSFFLCVIKEPVPRFTVPRSGGLGQE